ncbi:hypothetical protein HK099_001363 [Clydaea vesicula]|uniref:Uncharacterized protein n=1 Tax=Clydaea vesicula TaxID=447962 RepID=A0AAD5U546_9FUNG|nr:hypothetical protein HK099_001363 [Clydaea vesicula]
MEKIKDVIRSISANNEQQETTNLIESNFLNLNDPIIRRLNDYLDSLNFDVDNDFVVDIDLYWKQLGYSRKEKATNAILKFLDVEKDYFSTTSCHDSFSETGSKGG